MLLCRTHNLARFHKDNSYVGGDKFKQKTKSSGGSEDLSVKSLSIGSEKEVKKEEEEKTPEEPAEKPSETEGENPAKSPTSAPTTPTSSQPQTIFNFASPLSTPPQTRPKLESVTSQSSVSSVSSTGSIKDRMKAFTSGSASSSNCVCGKPVYPADAQVTLDGSKYHKACAKCNDCGCQITLSNFTKVGEMLLCRTHNLARFHKNNEYVGGDKFKTKAVATE